MSTVTLTKAQMEAEMVQLKAQIALLEAQKKAIGGELKMRVSEKGAISVYGLNAKWPVTLYAEQWARLAQGMFGIDAEAFKATALGQFIAANESKVARKNRAESTEAAS